MASKNELIVENWNLKNPVGTLVNLRKDNGTDFPTSTRSEAFTDQSGNPVCFFEGVSGYYLLSRATKL